MSRNRAWIVTLVMATAVSLAEARQFPDVRAVVDFQRAADSYAFLHRRMERSLAEPSAMALAQAIQSHRPAMAGNLFTVAAAEAMRDALGRAARNGCDIGLPVAVEPDPSVYGPIVGTRVLAPCAAATLPHLPDELEYRTGGNAIVVVDTHAEMVVDVLTAPLTRATTRR